MTSLSFYGGVDEVGGNKILLEDKDTKTFLDFGMSFGKRGGVQSHCSGHSKGQDLLDVVTTINAKMLFPIHTEHPTAYNKIAKNMTLVEEGVRYEI